MEVQNLNVRPGCLGFSGRDVIFEKGDTREVGDSVNVWMDCAIKVTTIRFSSKVGSLLWTNVWNVF